MKQKYVTVEEMKTYSDAMEDFLTTQVLTMHQFGKRLTKLEQDVKR